MNQNEQRLKELYSQREKINEEIRLLEEKLAHKPISKKLDKNEKIEVFKTLFVNRFDIYLKKWISKDGSKQNFYPVTATFKSNDFIPITNKDIEGHLRGQIQLASYLVDKENRSKYIVLEILESDIEKLLNTFTLLKINFLFEKSSYNSIFLWIFFEESIEAKNAKKFGEYILKKSNIRAKIFPTNEFASNATLGDFIELPLHLSFRQENLTLFFDPITNKIYKDQWQILQNIKKVTKETVLKYIDFETVSNSNLLFEDIEFPLFKLEIKLYDGVYIPTIDLSKSFINKLKSFATFDNPQVKLLLSLRKPLYNTPRQIKSFEEDDKYLKLPRGLIYKVAEFFDENSVKYEVENKTFLKKVETKKVSFTLRDEQQKAIDEISKSNFSICVAPPGFGKTLLGAKMFEIRACSTLIIVNKNMLLTQWIDRFVDYFGYSKRYWISRKG